MTNRPETGRPTLIERRVRRITNARSVTIGLALTYVVLALVGAIVIRITDEHNFPTFGLAVWWAVQTVTTVGYGDVVPTTKAGQFIGGAEMVIGISFIAFLVAGVTSAVVQRAQAGAAEDERRREEHDLRKIIDALAELRTAIGDLDKRLDKIDPNGPPPGPHG
jgi:voltage-gated potassium channel Kch